MEVLTENAFLESSESRMNDVLAEVRKNHLLSLLCILPGIESRPHKLKSSAKQMGISGEAFERYQKMLLDAGLWKIQGKKVIADFELLDLGDLTIPDHMAMTLSIMSQLSGDTPYEYESLSLATNRTLVKEFILKVRKALKELYDDSMTQKAENDCLFSWSQTGMVNVQISKNKPESEEDDDV